MPVTADDNIFFTRVRRHRENNDMSQTAAQAALANMLVRFLRTQPEKLTEPDWFSEFHLAVDNPVLVTRLFGDFAEVRARHEAFFDTLENRIEEVVDGNTSATTAASWVSEYLQRNRATTLDSRQFMHMLRVACEGTDVSSMALEEATDNSHTEHDEAAENFLDEIREAMHAEDDWDDILTDIVEWLHRNPLMLASEEFMDELEGEIGQQRMGRVITQSETAFRISGLPPPIIRVVNGYRVNATLHSSLAAARQARIREAPTAPAPDRQAALLGRRETEYSSVPAPVPLRDMSGRHSFTAGGPINWIEPGRQIPSVIGRISGGAGGGGGSGGHVHAVDSFIVNVNAPNVDGHSIGDRISIVIDGAERRGRVAEIVDNEIRSILIGEQQTRGIPDVDTSGLPARKHEVGELRLAEKGNLEVFAGIQGWRSLRGEAPQGWGLMNLLRLSDISDIESVAVTSVGGATRTYKLDELLYRALQETAQPGERKSILKAGMDYIGEKRRSRAQAKFWEERIGKYVAVNIPMDTTLVFAGATPETKVKERLATTEIICKVDETCALHPVWNDFAKDGVIFGGKGVKWRDVRHVRDMSLEEFNAEKKRRNPRRRVKV